MSDLCCGGGKFKLDIMSLHPSLYNTSWNCKGLATGTLLFDLRKISSRSSVNLPPRELTRETSPAVFCNATRIAYDI